MHLFLRRDEEYAMEKVQRRLVFMLYERNDISFHRGTKITASATLINDQMDYLKGIPLGYDEQIVYAESAHKLVYEDLESAPIVPEQLLTQRRFDDGNNSLWITFQRVQENIIKGGVKGKVYGENGPRKVTTRAVQSLDRNIKLNQALWVLTERMAELKSMAVAA